MISKDGWIKSYRKRKEETKARKLQKMKATLQKQGIVITEAKEKDQKEEVIKPKEELYYRKKILKPFNV